MSDRTPDELFAHWLASLQQGQPAAPEELCHACPDQLPALLALVRAYQLGQQTLSRPSQLVGDATLSVAPPPNVTLSHRSQPSAGNATSVPQLPDYLIERELGRGGMGVVYLAKDRKLNRPVAIKMILHGIVAGSSAFHRFQTEAEAMATVDHPNVAKIHARGEYEGLPYFVMEYCAGGSLKDKIKENPLSAREAATLTEQLARGIAATHERGILHRDLKPENVLLASDGTPKLTDFGLAKRLSDSDEGGLTQTGAVMGTPSYMAPEQARGDSKRTGPATDVYGLGAMLYRMLTGRPPFLGANNVETMRQVVEDEPVSPTVLTPNISRDLVTICLKCLRKEPTQRYATAADLAADLQRYLNGKPILARPVSTIERSVKWVSRNPVITTATLAVVASLLVGTIVSYAKYRDAKFQEGIAREQETLATKKTTEAEDRLKERNAALKTIQEREAQLTASSAELKYTLGNTHMMLANAAYDNNDMRLSREYLEKVPPEQRKFEWYYRAKLVEGGLFTLYGHMDNVTSVAFSPDGQRIATGSRDCTAKVWNAHTGAIVFSFEGHTSAVISVAVSYDGRYLATGGFDKTAKIWDIITGKLVSELNGHSAQISSVSFRPDHRQIVTGSFDKTIRIWSIASGKLTLQLETNSEVYGVAFSPDGHRVLGGFLDGTAKVWDVTTGVLLLVIRGHTNIVCGVAFSPDGKRIATGSFDRTTKVWDANIGTLFTELRGQTDQFSSVAFSPDGRRLLTGSSERAVKLWDTFTGRVLHQFRGHTDRASCVAFSPDGRRIVTGSYDKTAKVWDAAIGGSLHEFRGHTHQILSLACSPDGRRVATGSHDKTAKVWEIATGLLLFDLKGHSKSVKSVAFSHDNRHILTGGYDNIAKVWDAKTGQFLFDLVGHSQFINSVCFSPDGQRILTGSEDGTAKVWDSSNGKLLFDLKTHNTVYSATYSPDGGRIVTGGQGIAKIWNATTGLLLSELKGHMSAIWSVVFSPDSRRIASGSGDETVNVWDADSGELLLNLRGHIEDVTSVIFSSDSHRVLTCSVDSTVKIWDAATGVLLLDHRENDQPIWGIALSPDGYSLITAGYDMIVKRWDATPSVSHLEFNGHRGNVTNVMFSPDGGRIATSSDDGVAKVWDATTGLPILELEGHLTGITCLAISPDGQRLLTGSRDKTVRLWDITTGKLVFKIVRDIAIWKVAFSLDGRTFVVVEGFEGPAKLWDATTGEELKNMPFPEVIRNQQLSPDRRHFAHNDGQRIRLIPTILSSTDVERRLWFVHLHKTRQYWEGYRNAISARDDYATQFYLDRVLSLPTYRTLAWFRERQVRRTDPRLVARMSFHTPDLAETPYDRGVIQALAVQGDVLAKRLVAQHHMREEKPAVAIPLLYQCLLSREVTFPPKPPVEELLLAKAYQQMNQPEEAKKWYNVATQWLDQPRKPMRAVNLVSHAAVNSWAMLGEVFKPIDDPRLNTFDWEAWHECDVFRAQFERGTK